MELNFDHHLVLLVEDSPDDATLMAKAWTSAGLKNRLHLITDGEQALDYLRGTGELHDRNQHPYPIAIFLDLKLPRVDGLDVLAAIRSDPQLRHLSVDILSASVRSADVEKALELGANNYLVKPSRFDSLVEMLKAWHTLAKNRMFVSPPFRR